jgi:23S rRNA pseudouridine1911/1915/1917 synthase
MSILYFKVPPDTNQISVKDFLKKYCGVSSALLTCLKQNPCGITADHKQVYANDILQPETLVAIALPEEENVLPPLYRPVMAVWEDEHLIVFDKPANMPVHPSPGHDLDSLANVASAYAASKGQKWRFRPVNRLDCDTTGLVLAAKDAWHAARLSQGVEKTYLAVCEGVLKGNGTIRAPIRLKAGHSIQREIGEGGQMGVTHWWALGTSMGHTLLKVKLETGRTHQIRVHFACNGMPLAGDSFYGGSRRLIARQALHCMEMDFVHPYGLYEVNVRSPLPHNFFDLLKHIF